MIPAVFGRSKIHVLGHLSKHILSPITGPHQELKNNLGSTRESGV